MRLRFILFWTSFLFVHYSYTDHEPCSCYSSCNPIYDLIYRHYVNYGRELNRKFLDRLPKSRQEWEYPYHQKFRLLQNQLEFPLYRRYPDYLKNLSLKHQISNLVTDYYIEWSERLFQTVNEPPELKAQHLKEQIEKFKKNGQVGTEAYYECLFNITNQFAKFFEECLKKHKCLESYCDYGLLAFMNNNHDKALDLLKKTIDLAEKENRLHKLDSNMYQNLGMVHLEAMAYEKAIEYLSAAIQNDPSNKEAYFNRAIAYFETGDFDSSILDFSASEKLNEQPLVSENISNEFINSLNQALSEGAKDSATEFFPSLCNSINGISNCLWIGLNQPIESLQCFYSCCSEMGKFAFEAFSKLDKDRLQEIYDINKNDLDVFLKNYDELTEHEKGQFLGYAIGRGGVDILLGSAVGFAACKGIDVFQKLKNANTLCNFKTMLASNANKEAIIQSSLKHASERKEFFNNIKIHWDRQNKHIPGKHNFIDGRGTILIEPEELESLVKHHAGRGQRILGELGECGYRERIDFGKIIGEYALEIQGQPTQFIPTSKGVVSYGKNGKVHVWPSNPGAIIK